MNQVACRGTGDERPVDRDEADAALVPARRRMRSHGGDIRVLSAEADSVEIEFVGACRGCPAMAFTYAAVVEPALLQVEGVRSITGNFGDFSPGLISRIRTVTTASARPVLQPTRGHLT